MTPEQIELVRSSYASLDDASAMASDFYRRLFGIDPSARRLFSQDPSVMAEKFAAELSAIVQAIISFDVFSAGSVTWPSGITRQGCDRDTTHRSAMRCCER